MQFSRIAKRNTYNVTRTFLSIIHILVYKNVKYVIRLSKGIKLNQAGKAIGDRNFTTCSDARRVKNSATKISRTYTVRKTGIILSRNGLNLLVKFTVAE